MMMSNVKGKVQELMIIIRIGMMGAEIYPFETGQTLATPTPVKRASSNSCLRGSKLCNSSIMAGKRGRERA